jgi:hypothetical protein
MTDYAAQAILNMVSEMSTVEQVRVWNDRHYITLAASIGSAAKADKGVKLWLKGTRLTIESAKGYHSDAWIEAKTALVDAVRAAGGEVREV